MKLSTLNRFFCQWFIVFLLPAFVLGAQAAKAASPLEGNWAQLQSNAQACATCEVLVEPVFGRDGMLLVTANNGWTAQIFYDLNANHVAGGVGRWNTGQVFDLGLQHGSDGMEMRMRWKDGVTTDWIMASFKRAPLKTDAPSNAATTRFPSVAEQADLEPLSAQYDFTCDSGKLLSVVYDHRASESIAMTSYDGGRTSFLIQVILGSGTRFANEDDSLHTKGGNAVLTLNGQTFVCELG